MTIDLSGWQLIPEDTVGRRIFISCKPDGTPILWLPPISLSDLIASHNKLAKIQAAAANKRDADQAAARARHDSTPLNSAAGYAKRRIDDLLSALAAEPTMEKIEARE